MGLSYDYDCASSILLCAEDNSILAFDEEDEEIGHGHGHWEVEDPKSTGLYGFSFMGSFPLPSDECLDLLVKREADHSPRSDYAERIQSGTLDPSIRSDAIDWIGKAHGYYGFGPLTFYLSVNYLDRFLSEYEPPQGKAWMTQLLSVACLSLAAKMEETQVPLILDLQVGKSKYVFEARTIQRMELLVLSTLKWRMQAVTPFAFIDYFLHKLNDGSPPTSALIHRSGEIILSMIKGVDFLQFRPSEVAAATAMSVLGESQLVKACKHVEKERVLRCYGVIQGVALRRSRPFGDEGGSVSVYSVPMSPNGVLDAGCLSYMSEASNSYNPSPAMKRRKICRPSIS